MKRLKNKFLQMDLNTTTYQEMYNGSIIIIDPDADWAPPICTQDPTYYKGEIGFTVTGTHKLAQDKPTVTVVIPRDYILSDKRRSDILKRNSISIFNDLLDDNFPFFQITINFSIQIQLAHWLHFLS